MEQSLGLGGGVGWGDDIDKEIGEEEDDDEPAGGKATANGESVRKGAPPTLVDPFEGLSARQITMLKRKKGNIVEEANKCVPPRLAVSSHLVDADLWCRLRRLNQANSSSGPSTAGPSSADHTPLPSSPGPASITIEPGAKARAAASAFSSGSKGGAVEISMDSFDDDGNPLDTSTATTLVMRPGSTPWMIILSSLLPYSSDTVWFIRHGSALALVEILRSTGPSLPQAALLDIARSLLSLLALDRFGDFVGDTVIAPVRETAAQALGVLLRSLDVEVVREVHEVLMGMIKQPWAKRGKAAEGLGRGDRFAWEVRHAGLLGVKYEVAVRDDLLGGGTKQETKQESGVDEDVKMSKVEEDVKAEPGTSLNILLDVVDAAIAS